MQRAAAGERGVSGVLGQLGPVVKVQPPAAARVFASGASTERAHTALTREEAHMYIGIGALVLIILVVVFVL